MTSPIVVTLQVVSLVQILTVGGFTHVQLCLELETTGCVYTILDVFVKKAWFKQAKFLQGTF